MREPAQHPEPIVDRHDDRAGVANQLARVVLASEPLRFPPPWIRTAPAACRGPRDPAGARRPTQAVLVDAPGRSTTRAAHTVAYAGGIEDALAARGAGRGKRRAPTGGAAYRIPRNASTPLRRSPRTLPRGLRYLAAPPRRAASASAPKQLSLPTRTTLHTPALSPSDHGFAPYPRPEQRERVLICGSPCSHRARGFCSSYRINHRAGGSHGSPFVQGRRPRRSPARAATPTPTPAVASAAAAAAAAPAGAGATPTPRTSRGPGPSGPGPRAVSCAPSSIASPARSRRPRTPTGSSPRRPAVPLRAAFRRFWPLARPLRGVLARPRVRGAAAGRRGGRDLDLQADRRRRARAGELGPLVGYALAMLGLALLGAALSFGDEYIATWVGERFTLALRTRVFSHLQRLEPDALDRRRHGDVLARLTGDVHAVETLLLSALGELVQCAARLVFFAGALMLLSWKLALASLVVVPLFVLGGAQLRAALPPRGARAPAPQRLAHGRRRGGARQLRARAGVERPGARARALPPRERGRGRRRARGRAHRRRLLADRRPDRARPARC